MTSSERGAGQILAGDQRAFLQRSKQLRGAFASGARRRLEACCQRSNVRLGVSTEPLSKRGRNNHGQLASGCWEISSVFASLRTPFPGSAPLTVPRPAACFDLAPGSNKNVGNCPTVSPRSLALAREAGLAAEFRQKPAFFFQRGGVARAGVRS